MLSWCTDHQNFFGTDEHLGPVAVSVRREKLDPEERSNNLGKADYGTYHYRIICRTSEVLTLSTSIAWNSVCLSCFMARLSLPFLLLCKISSFQLVEKRELMPVFCSLAFPIELLVLALNLELSELRRWRRERISIYIPLIKNYRFIHERELGQLTLISLIS